MEFLLFSLEWNFWSEVDNPKPNSNISDLCMVSSDYGWMVGKGFALFWDGISWQKIDPQGLQITIY